MSPVLILRAASVLSVLFALGHTLGARKAWSPMGENDVLQSMKTVHFKLVGVSRSYWNFFLGFGLLLSVYLSLQAVLLWLLAGLAQVDWALAKPMVTALAAANAAVAVLAWRYLFPVSAAFAAIVTLCIGSALVAG